jgi:hypothetical protein
MPRRRKTRPLVPPPPRCAAGRWCYPASFLIEVRPRLMVCIGCCQRIYSDVCRACPELDPEEDGGRKLAALTAGVIALRYAEPDEWLQ